VVTKPRRTIARVGNIPFRYRRWLLSGRPGALVFIERERVAALWEDYGDCITARHIALYPGSRPRNWWRYSKPAPCIPGEAQRDYLERNRLLTPAEKRHAPRRS
jgi:hypothetical protein